MHLASMSVSLFAQLPCLHAASVSRQLQNHICGPCWATLQAASSFPVAAIRSLVSLWSSIAGEGRVQAVAATLICGLEDVGPRLGGTYPCAIACDVQPCRVRSQSLPTSCLSLVYRHRRKIWGAAVVGAAGAAAYTAYRSVAFMAH